MYIKFHFHPNYGFLEEEIINIFWKFTLNVALATYQISS